MSEDDEAYYRRQAKDAENFAERAIADRDRATWHGIALKWLALIRPRAEARAGGRGTHQVVTSKVR